MDGLMKGKHAQKNFGAVGAMAPTPLSLKTRGGGGGGGWVSHTRTGPGRPPVAASNVWAGRTVREPNAPPRHPKDQTG